MGVSNIKNNYKYNYIYGLFDPVSGECRYIGVSVRPKDRYNNHLNDKSDTWRVHWIQKLLSNGNSPVLFIFKKFNIDDDWQNIERDWIRYGKENGFMLTNCTNGGDGVLGISGEGYERMKKTWVGRKHKPETLLKISAASKLHRHTNEWKENMSVIMKGRVVTWGDKLSESNRKLSEEQIKEIRILMRDKVSQYKIADMYHVHQGTISNIKRGTSYKGIGEI